MTYRLAFVDSALTEWRKLEPRIRDQCKHKLVERLQHPHVPASRPHGLPNCCKTKLQTAGCRMVYQVDDMSVVVTVIVVGKRDEGLAYLVAKKCIWRSTANEGVGRT